MTVSSHITKSLMEAVHNAPEAIRQDHWPHNLDVAVNPHDIFEDGENPEGPFIARAFFSIRFWGYNTPQDIEEYRRRVLNLPLVIGIRETLGGILGPVKCQVYMRL